MSEESGVAEFTVRENGKECDELENKSGQNIEFSPDNDGHEELLAAESAIVNNPSLALSSPLLEANGTSFWFLSDIDIYPI
ncbi:hypothetical protein L1987_70081 [Smallanthus sonchifolius]|uniref:Uncharacterized protein n=1 Tax=Smallanthus sonchifolius TaxID=185202 RepID=A0ACB9AN04_9ASTR|nr:hypothetical protein L1987_70081 [Smallanthus sonchifolius]